jgi:hypothetical protein
MLRYGLATVGPNLRIQGPAQIMFNIPQTLAAEVSDAINALIKKSDRFRNWNDPEIQA